MNLLMQVFWSRKIEVSILFCFIFLVSVFSFLLPVSFSIIIEQVLPTQAEKHFYLLISGAFVLVILRLILNATQDYLFLFLRASIERIVSLEFLEKSISAFSTKKLERAGQASISNRLLIWLTNFQYFLSEFVYFCGYAIVVSVMVFIILYIVEPVYAYIGLVFLFLHWCNFSFHYPMSNRFSAKYNGKKGEITELLSSTFNAKRMVNIFQIEDPIERDLDDYLTLMHTNLHAREQVANSQELIQNVMRSLQFIVFVWVGVNGVLSGLNSIGELLLCILLIGLAYQPVYRLSKVTKALSETNTQMEQLKAVISSNEFSASGSETTTFTMHDVNAVKLLNINYQEGQQTIFKNLSYQFQKGKIYLIEGDSGQGKTTLLKFIAGLVPVANGQVLWDHTKIEEISNESRHNLLSWMTQASGFIEGSLQDNITLFSPTVKPDKLKSALKNAACDFTEQHASKDRLLESAARHFSGGQAQRLNLAKTLYHGGTIRLLDEPTANLDQETESLILQAICDSRKDHINILTSHRKSLRQYADKILCLRNGQLQEVVGGKTL